MWNKAWWLVARHTGSDTPLKNAKVVGHLDSAKENSKVLWFLTKACAKKKNNLNIGGREKRQHGILGAHVM